MVCEILEPTHSKVLLVKQDQFCTFFRNLLHIILVCSFIYRVFYNWIFVGLTMATESPIWLNASYVQKVLRKTENDESIEVSDITVKPATAKGDNYLSAMYRVTFKFLRIQGGRNVEGEKSIIVKTTFEGTSLAELIEELEVFHTELSMMSVTLPKMNEILSKASLPQLGAECLYYQYEKPTHMIVEDLAPKGFTMADREKGLDLDHCLVAIRNLARFHAASVALVEKDPDALATYNKGVFRENQTPLLITYLKACVKSLANVTPYWHELSPRISEKIMKLSDVVFAKGCEAAHFREDEFTVLNHGDFWINNMMFVYDERRVPVNCIFVDFQICHRGSPANDILYFIGTSPSDDVRVLHRELLLHEYHASLAVAMRNMNCSTKVPSFENLQEALKKRAFLEVIANMISLPIVSIEKGTDLDISKIAGSADKSSHSGYHRKSYKEIMIRVLPLYDSLGLLDV
ncbi:uncharacterized protein LOC124185044 [Neodiprion fabricii]|uniref:uncharacterized protein LOC124185044 n=1 Tax=Neodiprion fabricii TaxID=2872261 RepID=UPI001ED90120|nr:uncharacterized protein LOC124185044 [Neodiprion fabricii]